MRLGYFHSLMPAGTWQEDHRMTWRVSEPEVAAPHCPERGLHEPTLTEMPDRCILCLMRHVSFSRKGRRHVGCSRMS